MADCYDLETVFKDSDFESGVDEVYLYIYLKNWIVLLSNLEKYHTLKRHF